MSQNAKVWTALVTVYVIWGSTYLGIAYAGETIPPLFAVSTRFIAAGTLMAVIVTARGGSLRMSRRAFTLVRRGRLPAAGRERRALLRGAQRARPASRR